MIQSPRRQLPKLLFQPLRSQSLLSLRPQCLGSLPKKNFGGRTGTKPRKRLRAANDAAAKKKLAEANLAAQAAETKKKLAEQKAKEEAAAAEAEKIKAAEAKRKAALEVVATKNTERKARAAKAQAPAPAAVAPAKASSPKQKEVETPVPPTEEDAQHSQHQFPDPRDLEMWDSLGITETLWKIGEAEGDVETGDVYIPLTVSELVENLMSKLKELCNRDRTESAKIVKYEKRIASEDDEDILAGVQSLLKKITDANDVTKGDILVFKGKIRTAVDDLCSRHNHHVMEEDERQRKALEADAER